MKQLTSDIRDSMPVFVHREVISNSYSDIAYHVFYNYIND